MSLQINWSWVRRHLGMCQRGVLIFPLGSSQVGPTVSLATATLFATPVATSDLPFFPQELTLLVLCQLPGDPGTQSRRSAARLPSSRGLKAPLCSCAPACLLLPPGEPTALVRTAAATAADVISPSPSQQALSSSPRKEFITNTVSDPGLFSKNSFKKIT